MTSRPEPSSHRPDKPTWIWQYLPSLQSLHLYMRPVCHGSDPQHRWLLSISGPDSLASREPEPTAQGFGFVGRSLSLVHPPGLTVDDFASPQGSHRDGDLLVLSWRASSSLYSGHDVEGVSTESGCGESVSARTGCVESPRCRKCTRFIIDPAGQTPLVFTELPSPYWAELVDSWSCHRQEFAGIARHLIDSPQLLPPLPSTVFYSTDHFIIRRAGGASCHDGDPGGARDIAAGHDNCHASDRLSCLHCGSLVGVRIADDCYLIPMTRTLCSRGLETDLMARIRASIDAHSSFSFVLLPYDRPTPSLRLGVVNWTGWLCYGAQGDGEACPGFIVRVSRGSDGGDAECEQLYYFADEIDQLSELLADRVGLFPNKLSFLLGR